MKSDRFGFYSLAMMPLSLWVIAVQCSGYGDIDRTIYCRLR